ncbi:MAG TPA: Mpo1-like protein, partial [Chitinophagales bacterium]|nr:Mpo1-like protein [Chitinophagales bacterium]
MSKIQMMLDEYGSSHQNATNKAIHWVCVPLIFFSIVGLFWSIQLPVQITTNVKLNFAMFMLAGVTVYY